MAARRDRYGLTAKESKIVSKKSRLFDSNTQGIGLPQKSSKATITGRKPAKPKPTAGKGINKNVITTGGKVGRAKENKMRSKMGLPKLITTGKAKAAAKITKSEDRVRRALPPLAGSTGKGKLTPSGKLAILYPDGKTMNVGKGNNRGKVKTPGVAKKSSLQRGINTFDKEITQRDRIDKKETKKSTTVKPKTLKVPVKPRGGMGGGGLFGGGAIRKSR